MRKDAFNINKRVEEFCGISNSAIKILKAHITSCFYLSCLFSLWSRQPIFHGGKKLNSQKLFENGFGFLFFGGGGVRVTELAFSHMDHCVFRFPRIRTADLW